MLSAFTARPILELKQRDKAKIESVLLHGDRLLAGLNSGSLRVYRVNDNVSVQAASTGSRPSSASKVVELLRESEKFSRYKIDQLAVIKEANVLVSLSNGTISLNDLSEYEPQDVLPKAKGASLFAVTSNVVHDETTDIPEIVSQLAVAVKRRLLIWTWRDSLLSDEVQEISLATTIRTLTWVTGNHLIAGLASSYTLIDSNALTTKDIVGPGAIGGGVNSDAGRFSGVGVSSLMGGMGPMPLATRLSQGQVLLAKDINTHFVDTDGESLGRRQIPWPQAPDAIGYSYPYILALQTNKGTLEVRNPETLSSLQTIALPGAKTLHVPNPGVSLAHAGKGFLVCSERCIWRMDALDYNAQIDSLVSLEKFDEAISLLNMLEDALLTDKLGRLRETQLLKAEDLFLHKRYRQAFDIFVDVHAPPRRVISLFPSLIAGGAADSDGLDSDEAPNSEDDAGGVHDPPEKEETEDAPFIVTKADTASLSGSVRRSQAKDAPDAGTKAHEELTGKALKEAAMQLNSFLVDTRTRVQRVLDYNNGGLKDAAKYSEVSPENHTLMCEIEPNIESQDDSDEKSIEKLTEVARVVDSTLFRSYMFAQPSLAGSFFRLPNLTDAGVAEEKLMESKRYTDLIDFLYGKSLHEKALQVLESFAKDDSKISDVPEQLQGPDRIITYLQNVPPENIDLILKYVDWPMHTAPEAAMEVFVADTRNAEHLPRQKVLDYLVSVDPNQASRYLEHVIKELDEVDPELHHRLIQLYLDGLSKAKGDAAKEHVERLIAFLKFSRKYEAWRIVPILPKDDVNLCEARAIVLGRMEQHKQALEIYVFEMENPEKAEDYCNQVWIEEHQAKEGSNDGPLTRPRTHITAIADPENEKSTIYHVLLGLYLNPRSPRKQRLEPALDLLARHGSRLPASSTLNLLPEDLRVEQLESYFRGRMRAANAIRNQAKIIAGLRKVVEDDSNQALRLTDAKGRNRSVVIAEDRVCGVCHKRFGGAAIKVLPDNAVVHYGCPVR